LGQDQKELRLAEGSIRQNVQIRKGQKSLSTVEEKI
jgi:hypothetical protein